MCCRLIYTDFGIVMNFIKKTTARQQALAKKKSMVNLTIYVCFIPSINCKDYVAVEFLFRCITFSVGFLIQAFTSYFLALSLEMNYYLNLFCMQVDSAHHCARHYILKKEDPPFLEIRFVSDEIGTFSITNYMHFWDELLTQSMLVVLYVGCLPAPSCQHIFCTCVNC